jgi:protein SCO1/2
MKSIAFFIGFILLFSCVSEEKQQRVLPIIGNFDLEYTLVDGKEVVDTIFPKVPFFYFRNEDSAIVKSTDMKGKIWIADFFFTTCSSICPRMTKNMKKINDATQDLKEHVQFISFSINPNYDQPSVLKKYKEHYGINTPNWVFLTGDEKETHRLGIEDFRIYAGQEDLAEDGYAHSEAFTLVDKEGYVRGVYNVANPAQVVQLEKDLRKLLKYEYDVIGSK